jgi:putative FmdB family regulatory protein
MPTYEFRCPKGHKFTHFYKTMSTAPSQLPCGECGAVAERQLSGGAGFAFKGSGFYLTDYGKNAHRGGEKVTSATEPASSAGGVGAGQDRGRKV